MSKNKNIPPLRFPEFTGEWEKKKLGEVAEKVNSGKTPLGGESIYTKSGIIFIRSQNINNDKLELENITYIPNEINDGMKNSIVKPNDILLNITGASLGRSCVVPKDFEIGNVNQHVCIIRLNKENNPRFVQPIFSSSKGQNIFNSLQVGGGREGLNFESIKSIPISFPSLPEQTKIASFLTAVDEKIQALKKKKSLLEEYKKGVMQQLFSQELRFKDDNGNEFPEWEVKKLGEVLQIQGGYAFKSNLFNRGNIKVIRIGDIKQVIELEKFEGAISEEIPDKKYQVKRNDFLMALSGATFGKVGKIVDDGIAYINQRVALFRSNECLDFFYQLVQTYFFKNYINSTPSASAQPNISNSDILDFESFFPSIEEQTLIANFLSAIDEKIKRNNMQIEKIEIWKKGLLQKMFV
jgi:type I restriction enzyme S subunit